jgi:predicted enzyme related to lactoylglutathione lyase
MTSAIPSAIAGFAFTKLMVADLAAMERFYCDALGLGLRTRIALDRPGYAIRETVLTIGDGATLLNLVQHLDRPCPPPGEAVIGLSVRDIDAVIAAAQEAGGRVVTPVTAVPEHKLKVAYVADPEGHMLELLQPSNKSPPLAAALAAQAQGGAQWPRPLPPPASSLAIEPTMSLASPNSIWVLPL